MELVVAPVSSTRVQTPVVKAIQPASKAAARRHVLSSAPLSTRLARPMTGSAKNCRARLQPINSIQQDKVVVAALTRSPSESYDPTPFYEPLLRSLLLGIGAGVLCELIHVSTQLVSLSTQDGLTNLAAAISGHAQDLAPLFAWDHFVALGVWLALYVAEAAVISPILREKETPAEAAKAVRSMSTVPKKLLPLNLNNLKKALYYVLNPQAAALAYRTSSDDASRARPHFKRSNSITMDRETIDLDDLPINKRGNNNDNEPPKDEDKRRRGSAAVRERRPPIRTPSFNDVVKPDQDESIATKRARELRDRRNYLKNFWYAAAISSDVKPGKTHKVEILGRTIVLWRDPDTLAIKCLDNVCPHRGAPLDKGWVKKNVSGQKGHSCVVCPYHGWAFDGEGKLNEVPSASNSTALPKRSLVDSYPIEEKGGFVWMFFGSSRLPADERPPIPYTPELDDPKWRAVYGEIEFDCPHWGVFENAIDMAHIHYLHGDSFGNSSKPEVKDMTTSRDTFSVQANFRIHNKPVSPLWNWTATPDVPVNAKAMLPSSSSITIQLGAGVSMITFVNTVPISATRAVNRFCLIRNFALTPAFDGWARRAMFKILGEDKVMVEKLEPGKIKAELSLAPDLPQIAFRNLRQDWIDMGYGVEPEVTEGHEGSLKL